MIFLSDVVMLKMCLYVTIVMSALIIFLLLACICKMFMQRRIWRLRRERTQEIVTPYERSIFNPVHSMFDTEL